MPSAEAEPIIPCGVERTAREVVRLWAAHDDLDEEVGRLKPEYGKPLTQQRDVLYELIASFEQGVTHKRAVTAPGAMFQIMMVRSLVGDLSCLLVDDEQTRRCVRPINRLLYSVLALLERLSGVSAEEVGSETYMPRDLDVGLAITSRIEL